MNQLPQSSQANQMSNSRLFQIALLFIAIAVIVVGLVAENGLAVAIGVLGWAAVVLKI